MSTPTVDPRALAAQVAELIGHQSASPQVGRLFNVPASLMLAQARTGRVPHADAAGVDGSSRPGDDAALCAEGVRSRWSIGRSAIRTRR
jgi:hypothetical protein